jgi:hypothetical protein
MATVIQIKRSSGSTAPTTAALAEGELAYAQDQSGSGASAKLYIESLGSDGSTPEIHAIGGKFYTDAIDAATDSNTASTIVERDGSGNFSAGTITANLTGNADTATDADGLSSAVTVALSGDATGSATFQDGGDTATIAATLAASGVTAGTYGSGSAIPTITVDAKGRVTAVTTTATSSVLSIAGDTGTDDLTVGTDTFTFTGGTGVDSTVSNNEVTFAIGQAVGTGDSVTFADVTADLAGDVTSTGTSTFTTVDINGGAIDGTAIGGTTAAAGSFTTLGSSGNLSVGGDATITGNLTVNGTTTTVATTNTVVSDTLLELGNNTTSAANDSGIVIERGSTGDNAFMGWDESEDKFTMGTTTATGASTGDLTITVGTLVANLEGNVTGDLTGDVTGSITGGTVSGLTAAIAVADGGTGAGTFTSNGIVYGNGTGALQATGAGTDGYILYSNGGTPDWTNTLDGGSY